MSLTLYTMSASPPARTVLIVADILGLEIEKKEVNLLKKEHLTPEYSEKNPLRTIPLLEDGDFLLADSHAIIMYLASKYGAEKAAVLYPDNLEERAIIHQRLFFDASILFVRHLNLAKDILAFRGASDENKIASIKEAYGFLEKFLERSAFVAGENMTLADISIVTSMSNVNVLVPLDGEYPKIQAWIDVLSNEEWYQKYNVPGVSDFKGFLRCFNKNIVGMNEE